MQKTNESEVGIITGLAQGPMAVVIQTKGSKLDIYEGGIFGYSTCPGESADHALAAVVRTFLVRFGEFEKGGLRTTASGASSFVPSSTVCCHLLRCIPQLEACLGTALGTDRVQL